MRNNLLSLFTWVSWRYHAFFILQSKFSSFQQQCALLQCRRGTVAKAGSKRPACRNLKSIRYFHILGLQKYQISLFRPIHVIRSVKNLQTQKYEDDLQGTREYPMNIAPYLQGDNSQHFSIVQSRYSRNVQLLGGVFQSVIINNQDGLSGSWISHDSTNTVHYYIQP